MVRPSVQTSSKVMILNFTVFSTGVTSVRRFRVSGMLLTTYPLFTIWFVRGIETGPSVITCSQVDALLIFNVIKLDRTSDTRKPYEQSRVLISPAWPSQLSPEQSSGMNHFKHTEIIYQSN